MKLELEKEIEWDIAKQQSITTYWVKANGKYIDLSNDYYAALVKYNNVKERYIEQVKEVLLSDELPDAQGHETEVQTLIEETK
jgi:hypothetical protein